MYRVKIFDFEHESDLEEEINNFLQKDIILKEIKYHIEHIITHISLAKLFKIHFFSWKSGLFVTCSKVYI